MICMYNKFKACYIIFSLLCTFSISAQSALSLEILFKNGTKSYFSFDSNPKISFTESDLVISASDLNIGIPLQTMAKYSFVDKISGFDNISSDENRTIRYYDNVIICEGFEKNDMLQVSDISGKTIFTAPVTDYCTQVDISSISNGIYIVTIQDITIKIYVR